jgi:hypothetical protein
VNHNFQFVSLGSGVTTPRTNYFRYGLVEQQLLVFGPQLRCHRLIHRPNHFRYGLLSRNFQFFSLSSGVADFTMHQITSGMNLFNLNFQYMSALADILLQIWSWFNLSFQFDSLGLGVTDNTVAKLLQV